MNREQKLLIILWFFLKVFSNTCSGCSMKNAGIDAANKISDELFWSSVRMSNSVDNFGEKIDSGVQNVVKSVNDATKKITDVMDKGINVVQETVKDLSGAIVELGKSINVRLDSGDLAHIGKDAAEQLKEAVVELSRNWQLVVNTADLKDFGATAAMHLSLALQNIQMKITVRHEISSEVVTGIGYISTAVGVAFGVLFCAIVVCLGTKLPCCSSICESMKRRNNSTLAPQHSTHELHSHNIRQPEQTYTPSSNTTQLLQGLPKSFNQQYTPMFNNNNEIGGNPYQKQFA